MSDSQEALNFITDQARKLLTEHSTPDRLKKLLDEPGSFDRDLWAKTNELGWCAAALPEDVGGIGLGWPVLCQLAEVLGEFTVSLPLLQNTLVVDALTSTQTAEQAILDRLISGEAIASLGLVDRGSAVVSLNPSATVTDGKISGEKSLTAFGAVADYALVNAVDSGDLALVLVDLHQPEVKRDIVNVVDNARAAAFLSFEQAQCIPVCRGENAQSLLLRLAAIAAIVTSFEQVGGTQACLTMALEYAKERKVFSQPIGAFQAIKHNLANIYTQMEVARGCAIDALEILDIESPALLAYGAVARLGGIKAYEFAAKENIQIHGGIGITWEAQPHHHYRRSRALALELGAAPFWRDLLVDNIEQMAEGY